MVRAAIPVARWALAAILAPAEHRVPVDKPTWAWLVRPWTPAHQTWGLKAVQWGVNPMRPCLMQAVKTAP